MVQSPGKKPAVDLKASERDTSIGVACCLSSRPHGIICPSHGNSRRVFGFCFDWHLRVEGKRVGARHSLP